MTENFEPFSYEQIHQFVITNQENSGTVTLQELKQPTGFLVQKLYFNFMQEFGFSESLLQLPFDLLESDHLEVVGPMVPVLSLQAAVTHLLNKLVGNTDFGVTDLLRPQAKRTQNFLSVMQNFWMFCNGQYNDVERVQAEVDRLVRSKGEMEEKIELFKNKINQLKSKAIEEKAEEESLAEEVAFSEGKMRELVAHQKELTEVTAGLNQQLAAQEKRIVELREQLQGLQTERDNLQGVFEGAAVLQRLEQELQDARDDLGQKEKRKLEFRNNLEVLDRLKGEYTSVLDLVKQVAGERQKTRELESKMREVQGQMVSFKLELEEGDSLVREKEIQVEKKKEEGNKMKVQWNRKKKGKEEEILSGSQELDHAKKHLGQEELAVVELSNQIRNLDLRREVEMEEQTREAVLVRAQYSTLLEGIEKFNFKLREDLDRVEKAKEKLNFGPPAL